MCSCGLNIIPSTYASGYVNTIPFVEIANGTTRAKFKWYFCISPEKVNNALSVIKVNPNEPLRVGSMSDMEALADYHDKGLDVQNYNENIWTLLSKINFTQEELDKSKCSTAFTY